MPKNNSKKRKDARRAGALHRMRRTAVTKLNNKEITSDEFDSTIDEVNRISDKGTSLVRY